MTVPQIYAGCDISKAHLDVFNPLVGDTVRLKNTPLSATQMARQLSAEGVHLVFEASGPYTRNLRVALDAAGCHYSCLNPTRARRFAEAMGYLAKTDRIDARMLSDFGTRLAPPPEPALDPSREALAQLQLRRDQLVEARAKEKIRLQTGPGLAKASITRHIAFLTGELKALGEQLERLLASLPELANDNARLRTAPGVGPVTAGILVAQLPELGHRSPGQIAALVGLAPFNCESGQRQGRRRIRGGRARIRRAMYMAALQASQRSPRYRDLYLRVKTRSGSAKVALIAVARKLLVALNAMQKTKTEYRE